MRRDLLARFDERSGVGYLRSDMSAEPDQFEVRQTAGLGVVFEHLRQRDAELAVAMAG